MPERKIFKAEIAINDLPDFASKALKVLAGERNLVIKGGCAKAVFEHFLMKHGETPRTKALKALMDSETDLDLIFVFVESAEKEAMEERFASLRAKLAKENIKLKGNDIELVRNKKNLSEEFLAEKIFHTRDFTINEILLFPSLESGKCVLYCTDMCYRDTLNGIGVLTGNTSGTVWYSYGRLVPTNYGLYRMLRILIDEKVKKIYLPQWWVDINLAEAERLGHTNMGAYGLLLGKRYSDKPKRQETMMKYLNALGIEKEISDFSEYLRERERDFESRSNYSFELKEKTSFQEAMEAYQAKEEKKTSSRQSRKQERESCDHYLEEMNCAYCKAGCKIKYCIKCKFTQATPKDREKAVDSFRYLLCNYNWQSAGVYWDKAGFFPREK